MADGKPAVYAVRDPSGEEEEGGSTQQPLSLELSIDGRR